MTRVTPNQRWWCDDHGWLSRAFVCEGDSDDVCALCGGAVVRPDDEVLR